MVAGVPRMCMRQTGQPRRRTSGRAAGSCVRAETSLTMRAPASSAAAMVPVLRVSMESTAPWRARAAMTGRTRACSSSGGRGVAPGRVLSPPMSMMSAPSSSIRSPEAMAMPGSSVVPPSLKLSGVTLRMPMSAGRLNPAHGGGARVRMSGASPARTVLPPALISNSVVLKPPA